MLARSARRGVAIMGLLALCLPLGARFVMGAAPQPCSARHDVAFATAGDSASQAIVASLACATARVRGLTARTPVTVRLVDAATLRAEVGQISQQDTATQPLAGTAIALQLLGALGPHDDLAAIRRAQYNVNTAAEYDYHTRTLFIRATNGHYTPLDRAIIAHEYTRALQDQYFNLSTLLSPSTGGHDFDALLAREAVVEGDAINTMTAVATATFSHQDLLWLNQQLQRPSNVASDFPHDLYGFPAAQGTNFVKAVIQAAAKGKHGDTAQASGNVAVNQALASPPTATVEIVNPSLYLQHVHAGDPAPALPAVNLGSGWVAVDSDVLGSFGISDLLGDRAPQAAAQAGAQWQSDRWGAYQRGSDTILLWRARFSNAAGAQAFSRALTAYTAARFHATLKPQTSLDWYTTGYAISVREQGVTVAVAMGSNKDLLSLCTRAASLLGAS